MNVVEDRLKNVEAGLETLTASVAETERTRAGDRVAAIKARNDQHGEVMGEFKRINGSLAGHETRITVIEKIDVDRKWSAGGGIVTPVRVAGVGVAGVSSAGLLWLLAKLDEILALLSQLSMGP